MKKFIALTVLLICVGLFAPYYPNALEYLAIKKMQPETTSVPNGQISTMEQAKAQFLNELKQAQLTVEQTKGLNNALSALRNKRIGLPRLADKAFELYRFAKGYQNKMSTVDYNAFLDFAIDNTQTYSIQEATK